jgi:hypothetical protein
MRNISGITGAAPIWNEYMRTAHSLLQLPADGFNSPPGVRQFEVCADTGTVPSEACPERRQYWYAEDRPPLPPDKDLYQLVRLDRASGKLATETTPQEMIEEKVFKIYPPEYRQWAEEHGIVQPPSDASDVFDFAPEVVIRSPVDGEVVDGVVTVIGSANAPAFASFELQYGISHEPGAFSEPVAGPFGQPVVDGMLGEWDVGNLENGPHTLRLVVRDTYGNEYDGRVRVFVSHATPTATPQATLTWTPESIPTATSTPIPPTATETIVITDPPTNTPEPTWTVPVDTPISTDTPLPTDTLIPTDTPFVEPTATWTPTVDAGAPITPGLGITAGESITADQVITAGVGITAEGSITTP